MNEVLRLRKQNWELQERVKKLEAVIQMGLDETVYRQGKEAGYNQGVDDAHEAWFEAVKTTKGVGPALQLRIRENVTKYMMERMQK